SIKCGSSCGPNRACARMGTTCFSITTPRAATWRWTWTSALRSRARLNSPGKFTPPRLRRAWGRWRGMWRRRADEGNPRCDSCMARGEQPGLRRKVVGDLRRLVGRFVETRNDYYVSAEVEYEACPISLW